MFFTERFTFITARDEPSSLCRCKGNQRIVTKFSAPGVENVKGKVFAKMQTDYSETPDIYEKFLDVRTQKLITHL